MQEFGSLFIFVALSFIFGICMIVCSMLVAPKTKNNEKESLYECGIKTNTDSRIKFNIQFFVYAILFLIFDIETIFLFPFALTYNFANQFVIIEVVVFIALLLLGLIYAIRKGMLKFR